MLYAKYLEFLLNHNEKTIFFSVSFITNYNTVFIIYIVLLQKQLKQVK